MSRDNQTFEDVHWADNSAKRVIEQFPDEEVYVVASGITPSGYIHIGNFREVITSEFVRRALEDKGKKTKFIYSWDSYDAFRKVPNDVPEEWKQYLRMPDGEVPNPFGEGSYADHFTSIFEDEVSVFNFPIVFQHQFDIQSSGLYADYIKQVMQNKQVVIDALNKYRSEPLADDWMPIDVYDEETRKDTNKILSYDGEYSLTYVNEKGTEKVVNFKEDPRVKLRWKADWPMRWAFYRVAFEPGGKDHSTPGSSYTVGCEIVKEIFDREPPVYTAYDWVRLKGQGGKISSSKGGALRVKDVLDVYTPEMVLFLFVGTRPNAEFDISFDMDVIKIYEDFDKIERLYYGLEEEKNPKQLATKKRIYELSMVNGVEVQKDLPFQPGFRHLTTVLQANDFDVEKVLEVFSEEIKTDFDRDRVVQRCACAQNWLEMYAPEEMRFVIRKIVPEDELAKLENREKEMVREVVRQLDKFLDPKELHQEFKTILEAHNSNTAEFFRLMYGLIIGKEKGPKLANFMLDNKERMKDLLVQV